MKRARWALTNVKGVAGTLFACALLAILASGVFGAAVTIVGYGIQLVWMFCVWVVA